MNKQQLIKTITEKYNEKKAEQNFSMFYLIITEYRNRPTKEIQDKIMLRFSSKYYGRNEKYLTTNSKVYQTVSIYEDYKNVIGVSLSVGKFKPLGNLPRHQLMYILFRIENPTEKDLEMN